MTRPPPPVEFGDQPAHEKDSMRRLTLLALLLTVVATACKIETNFHARINASGSGVIIAEVGMDEEAQTFLLTGENTDPFEGNDLSDCVGARTSEDQRGELHFWVIECDIASLEEFEATMTSTENTFMQSFDITVTDSLVTVTGSATAEESLGEDTEGFDPSVLEDSISANLRITMPGRIIEHNADSVDGNTLTWEIPILGGTLNVSAQSDPRGTPAGGGSGGFPIWLIVVIVVVVLLALYLFMQSKKKGAAASPPPAAA